MRQLLLFFIITLNLLRADALPEYTLKTAYLYNFALLTDWPENDQSDTFNICFYREDFGAASDTLNNKFLHNQKVKITTISSSEEAKGCHMIFIRESEEDRGGKMVQKLSGKPILIVSESQKVVDSHILISRENRKIAFDINLKPIKQADLSVSSRLLKLARRVDN